MLCTVLQVTGFTGEAYSGIFGVWFVMSGFIMVYFSFGTHLELHTCVVH